MGVSSLSSDSGLKDGTQASGTPRMCSMSELHPNPSSYPSLGLKFQRSYTTYELILSPRRCRSYQGVDKCSQSTTRGQTQRSLSLHTRKSPLHWVPVLCLSTPYLASALSGLTMEPSSGRWSPCPFLEFCKKTLLAGTYFAVK